MKPACTILLIEDELLIRLGTVAILEDAGYTVLEAGDAGEALSVLASHPEVEVVVTDVQMPGSVDGLMLVEIISREFPSVRSIVASGRAGMPEARKSGAMKFLSKPYSAKGIETAIQEALAA